MEEHLGWGGLDRVETDSDFLHFTKILLDVLLRMKCRRRGVKQAGILVAWARILAVEVMRSGQPVCGRGSAGLVDGPAVRSEKRRGRIRDDSKAFGLSNWKLGDAINGAG